MRVAVFGATGAAGRRIVDAATRRGHDVLALSRATGVDVLVLDQVRDALAGADAVIDAVNTPTLHAQEATEFFRAAAANIVRASAEHGVTRVVALSIVGIDRNPHGYYAGKLAQERVYADASVSHTIVRATQFHEFAGQIWSSGGWGPVHAVFPARLQPVDLGELAEILVDAVEDAEAGGIRHVAGPRVEELPLLVKAWARATGHRGIRFPIPAATDQLKGMRDGANLPDAALDAPLIVGTIDFDAWLATQRTR